MKKYLLPLLFTSFLFAELSTVKTPTAVNYSFELNNTRSNFDTALSYTHKPLLSCSPKLSAVYKIKSASKLKVIPKQQLHSSTQYTCSYENSSFTFQTKEFKLLSADFFKNEKILRLSFNDTLDKKSLLEGIKLTRIDKLSITNLRYKVLENDGQNLVIQINEEVGNDFVELHLNSKLSTTRGVSYPKEYHQSFNENNKKITLDPEKKSMTLVNTPRMVALPNGDFALRIFVNDNLTGQSKDAISIEGIENFQVSNYDYMDYRMRKRYEIKDAYYYHDVTSKEFKPNTSYKVTLKAGLTSYYREIKKEAHYTVKTADRAKSIIFNDKKPYISNKGELAFSSVNIDKATLIVERILDDNLRYFMNFTASNEESVERYTKEVFSKELTLNQKKNELLKQKFKLSDLSKEDLAVGIYKVTIRYEELIDNKNEERYSSKVLFLSNLGITANIGEKQAFVSVFSLDKAKTLKGVEVQVYGANNELLGESKTDNDGVAIINNKNMLKSLAKGIIVKSSTDQNFLALSSSINSPSLKQLLEKTERFKAHVYFQSNIVRPDAKINALITIKDRDFISASKLPIKIVFKELYGKKVKEKIYHTDNYGLINFNYQLDANDKIGNYQLAIYMGNTLIGKKSIKVEAFMPPKIENSIKTDKEIYQIDELMYLNIHSSYLFGAPASNLQGKVTLNARPIEYKNTAFKNYSFSNDSLAKENINSYIDHREDIILDANGKLEMVMKNSLTQKVPSLLEAMLGVTIMDDAQPVSNYKKVKIYPYKSMVGLKINSNSFEKGQKLEGKAILIDPFTNQIINRKLFAVVKQIEWHYTYADGNYNWDKETTVVDRFSLNSNESFSREIAKNGDYVIEVHDRLQEHSASQNFDVFWWNYSNISPKDNLATLEIKFEDKLYQKGDVLDVQVKSPILEGQLLLTLEGDKVHNYKVVTLKKGVAKVSLEITEKMKRGLRLHATAIRATNSPSMLIPFRAMGYKFVKANREAHKIKIDLELPKITKSKSTLSLNIKTSKPSKILVSIVDRGILQLVEQEEPKIFDYFNEEPSKQLSYHDLYEQLLSHVTEGKLVDFGAGDMLSKKQKHLAPDLGKRIKPFMIWSGTIESADEMRKLEIDIPEFNGRASVVAIAINEDSIGVSSKDIEIKDDIMIKPSYPLYGLVGDKISVPIRIFNTTKKAKNIMLTAKKSDNLSLELEKNSLEIPANSSKVLVAKLSPTAVGKGEITLTSNDDNSQVTKSIELPILSPYALSTKTFRGISNKKETFTVPSEYQGAKAYITLSNNLLGALRADLKYLVSYPYGCAEQTASKLSALHYAKAFFADDELLKESENFILQGVKKLHNMQNYYGEFSYWEGGGSVSAYASLYATQTLLEIDKTNPIVKKELKEKMLKMLNAVASESGEYQAEYSKFHKIYAAYILAQNNELSTSTANMLYEKKAYKGNFLATYYMAAILKATGKEEKAQTLFAQNDAELSRYTYKAYGNQTGNFESNVRDMMLYFLVKTKYAQTSADDLDAIQKEFSNLYSTQDKAIALKAISTYLGSPKNSKMNVTLKVNGESSNYTKPIVLTVDKVTNSNIILEPNHSNMSYAIELVKNLPKALKNQLSSQQELSVKREFITANGAKVDLHNLKQGDKFFSKITLVNFGKIANVVVSQRVPACMSIVNNNIGGQEPHFKDENINLQHKEIRDDRILYFIDLAGKKEYSKTLKKEISVENTTLIYSPLLATSIGECKLPAIITEAMYDTRIADYAKESDHVIVQDLNSSTQSSFTPNEENETLKKETLAKKAEKFVKKVYIQEMNSNNPLEFSDYFDYPLNIYFRNTNFSKEELLADKRKYFKEWSKRVYTNISTNIESINEKKKKVKVSISFDYKIYNGKKVLTGMSNHLLTVIEKEGKFLVKAIELPKKK
ncbi:MAG: Alpha-2-macroglobulin [uncultured Sulfurovum sp.]|uniref:Alpha-2-macroglobulin n=1 Tax=uncultured Sulfurovum sp. TaxID=269237 RepID=A0A6S6U987_9BACT|nr:MAG: Alpha-2-macroglobulin [uncultured Sulfurovum sp.]